jgi:hypothetical protein
LERWLGKEKVAEISASMKDFYWPVAIHGVPGAVYAMPGGDFAGEIKVGSYFTAADSAATMLKKIQQYAEKKLKHEKALHTLLEFFRAGRLTHASVGAFASVDAVVAAYTGGKGQQILFSKTGTAPTAIGGSMSLWTKAGYPAAGAAAAAAPGGTVPTATTTGALPLKNLGTAGTMHYLNATVSASVINNSLLMYDRIFAVAAGNALTTGAEIAVTGVPTRYQNGTAGNDAYIGGNFCFPVNSSPTVALAATGHNWDAGGGAGVGMTYLDEGSAASNMPVLTGISACAGAQIDIAVGAGSWFAPLAAGDVGIKALTNMSASAAVATGAIDWVIGHPIAIMSCPVALLACVDDGLYTALNLTHIEDSACLEFLEMPKPATTATTYSGVVRVVGE